MNPDDPLELWQAFSDDILAKTPPEELFYCDFVPKYQEHHADIWYRMTRLHGTIVVLEKLRELPLDELFGPNEFWHLFVENFLDTGILSLHGLLTDNNASAHTLKSFRKCCENAKWRDDSMRDRLRGLLKQRNFDGALNGIANRVQKLRNSRVAHRFKDKTSDRLENLLDRVTLEEMRRLFDGAHSIFGALSFGSSFATLTQDFAPVSIGGTPVKTSVDHILDAILKDNDFVTKPERKQQWWNELRKTMSDSDLQRVNTLRARVGLPEA